MLVPPKTYQECIVITAEELSDFTWSGTATDPSSLQTYPVSLSPGPMLNGQYAISAAMSATVGLPDELKTALLIKRGFMNTGSNDFIPKIYSDTQILSCCDFTVHEHVEVDEGG